MRTNNDENFYEKLPPFTDFLDLTNLSHYHDVPQSWSLILSDIQGSTSSIEQGKYKLVNMLGAASIAGISNALESLNFPLVFGGDGATALVPSSKIDLIKKYLRSIQHHSGFEFSMNLRVGIIPLENIYREKKVVKISKFKLDSGVYLAFFKGSGIDWAEQQVKSGQFLLEPGESVSIDVALNGLSCRWAPLRHTQGLILSLLIKERPIDNDHSHAIIKKIIHKIDEIADLSSHKTHPLKPKKLRSNFSLAIAQLESRLVKKLSTINVYMQILFTWALRHLPFSIKNLDIKKYATETSDHCDYRKFDEMLRMVIDCTPETKSAIIEFLENEYKNGQIYFGYSESEAALLTCYVRGLDTGKHIHFIDGSDGGYTLAAKQLKKQMKTA